MAKDSGLIHSVVVTPANVHDLTPAAELLHGDEEVVAMRPGKRRVLPDTPEGRLDDLVETAKAHIRSKGEYPFDVI